MRNNWGLWGYKSISRKIIMSKTGGSNYSHIPVLLKEVIELLEVKESSNYVDATLGGSGYSREILKRTGTRGALLSVDMDSEALTNAEEIKSREKIKNWIIEHGNFRDIDRIVEKRKFKSIAGIVADLGLSSNQLDNSGRGISFQKDEALDMRFDAGGAKDARLILASYEQNRLAGIFKKYGEEKFSRQIARKISETRSRKQEIKTTAELYAVIKDALPKPFRHRADDSARRVFQALRIEVNDELNNLREFLEKGFALLAPGGRLAVVSFHSLEDRMVKHFFSGLAAGCVCPPDFPECRCGRSPRAEILTKKPVTASKQEAESNSRSRPAKLRAVIKL